MRILVVDDFHGAAEMACTLLQFLGHECRCARSGREALTEVAAFDPDVVILDIGLPDLDGYEVAREIRKRPRNAPVYVAALSGWEQREDLPGDDAAAIDEHVMKPAGVTELRAILDSAEKRRRGSLGPTPRVPEPA